MMRLFPLLALGACSNSLSERGDAPFKLSGINTALWIERDGETLDGDGRAYLLLSDVEGSCNELELELKGDIPEHESQRWTSRSVLAHFAWEDSMERDQGWEGIYYGGFYPLYYWSYQADYTVRLFSSQVFSDGVVYDGDYWMGEAEVEAYSGDEVEGWIETEMYEASFTAEHCGSYELGGGPSEG